MLEQLKAVKDKYPDELENLKGSYSQVERVKKIAYLGDMERACRGDENLWGLLNNLITECFEYTRYVLALERCLKNNCDEKIFISLNTEQAEAHNAVIKNTHILLEAMAQKGKDTNWSSGLGSSQNRSTYSWLALALACQKMIIEENTKI